MSISRMKILVYYDYDTSKRCSTFYTPLKRMSIMMSRIQLTIL